MNYRQDIAFPGYKRFPLPTSVFLSTSSFLFSVPPMVFLLAGTVEKEEEVDPLQR